MKIFESIYKNGNKNFTNIKDISIKNIVASNKVSFGRKGFKYFIGYKNAKKIGPLKISASFLIKDEELLEKYNEIWGGKLKIASKKNLMVNLYTMKNF